MSSYHIKLHSVVCKGIRALATGCEFSCDIKHRDSVFT